MHLYICITCRLRRDCAEAAAASRDSAPRERRGTEYSRRVSDPAVSRASAQIVTCVKIGQSTSSHLISKRHN